MKTNDKFLLQWLSGVTKEQVFMFFWIGIGAMFVGAILWQWQRSEQRNFRPNDPLAPPKGPKRNMKMKDAPRLGAGGVEEGTKKLSEPPKRLGK